MGECMCVCVCVCAQAARAGLVFCLCGLEYKVTGANETRSRAFL